MSNSPIYKKAWLTITGRNFTHQQISLVPRAPPSLASQPYLSAYVHARAKVGGGREGKICLGTPGFCDSVVCAECIPCVHNDY